MMVALLPNLDCPEIEGVKEEAVVFIQHIAQLLPSLYRAGMKDEQLAFIFRTLAEVFENRGVESA